MNLYEVKVTEDETVLGTRYAGSAAEARARRTELLDQFKVPKSYASIERVTVSTQKPALLETLNALAERADVADEEGAA